MLYHPLLVQQMSALLSSASNGVLMKVLIKYSKAVADNNAGHQGGEGADVHGNMRSQSPWRTEIPLHCCSCHEGIRSEKAKVGEHARNKGQILLWTSYGPIPMLHDNCRQKYTRRSQLCPKARSTQKPLSMITTLPLEWRMDSVSLNSSSRPIVSFHFRKKS